MRALSLLTIFALFACSAEAPSEAAPPDSPGGKSLADIVGVGSPEAGKPKPSPTTATSNGKDMATAVIAGARQLDYPDDLQMVMLDYRLRGVAPPIADWAKRHGDVTRADEFSRAEKLQDATQELQAIWDSTADVGRFKMRVGDIEFSEYDPDRKGFYVNAFEPGSSYEFKPFGGGSLDYYGAGKDIVVVEINNKSAAHFWPLTFEDARGVFERNSKSRWIVVDMVLTIKSIQRRGSESVIHARVDSYDVLQQMNREARARLATVVVH